MTLYARGYRPYDGRRDATRFAFLPIQREALARIRRGRAFWFFLLFSAAALVVFTVLLYVGETFGPRSAGRMPPGIKLDTEAQAAWMLQRALVFLQQILSWFGVILTLFVGAGLVADDLRSRALPLYLVRPVTPFDYWLGKLLVPLRVLAWTLLLPGLMLVLLGALFQPSDRMLPFLWDRRNLVFAVVAHWTYVSLVWGSLALLASTIARSRLGAIVLGAIVFFAGPIPRAAARHVKGAAADLLESASLYDDARAVLAMPLDDVGLMGRLPPSSYALAVGAAVVLLAAFVVLRRARTVEVVA